MPGVLNTPLNDAEIAALVNWILKGMAGASTPENTPPYTAGEIARFRLTRPSDVMAARRALLEKLRAKGVPQDR